jgi:hypothetical protein
VERAEDVDMVLCGGRGKLRHVGRGERSVGGLTEFEDEAFESAGRAKQKHVCGLVADDLKAVG